MTSRRGTCISSCDPECIQVLDRYSNQVHVIPTIRVGVMSISASEARRRLFPLLEQVNADHLPVRISSKSGDVVLMSADDYDAWQETVYLLRSPQNARRLMEAVARDKAGHPGIATSFDELRALASGSE